MPRVGWAAMLLGFAGLLPQMAAAGLILLGWGGRGHVGGLLMLAGYWLGMGYGALILSFLGGIWWGFAMRRDRGQGGLAAIAVLPSLVAFATLIAGMWDQPGPPSPWPAIALGSAIMLTLLVDRHLIATGEAPSGWMRLRAPLSLGLGALTIAIGLLMSA